MIGFVIAVGLFAATNQATWVADQGPLLTIDPCVEVDESIVRELMDLEIRDARARRAVVLPTSVTVRCTDGVQEIRVEPATSEDGGVRTIQLPDTDAAVPAMRQARSRELALAIAELIRRLEVVPPAPPASPPPPPPPPAVAAMLVDSASPPGERPQGRWRLGALSTFDYFTGGQKLAGGDLFVGARMGRWLLSELRVGGRTGVDIALSGGHLTSRALTVGAAVGLNHWSRSGRVGAAFMLRAQEYLVWFRAVESGAGSARTTFLGAVTLAGEPRLMVAVTRRFALEAAAAVGYPLRGIAVRMQGDQTESMSGLVFSGSLAGVLRF